MAYTTIDKPTDYFNTKLYTGNGTDAHGITGVGFQPDFVWLKSRSEAEHHTVNDSVRGVNKQLYPHLSFGEASDTDRLQSFDSDGFTLGTDVVVNKSSQTYVSWNWYTGATASSNTDGSITSTVSANTTAGFSIVSWTSSTGADTVGHGLGVTPQVVISKTRSVGNNWTVHTTIIDGSNDYLFLNTTGASGNSSYAVPTSSIFNYNYGSSTDFISYVFAEKKGYSKFGSYTGNGNADGTFVYTGFKPAMVIGKASSRADVWWMHDNKRDTINPMNRRIMPDSSSAEGVEWVIDYLSNGFKIRTTDAQANGSGHTYIYMAFAENPFVTSTGVPTCAR